jgi:hypothetical protein
MNKQATISPSVSGNTFITVAPTSSSAAAQPVLTRSVRADVGDRARPLPSRERVEGAVYAHIQALRALGREEVNVSAISEALGINESAILAALDGLSKKGVKVK